MPTTSISLRDVFFGEAEREIARAGELVASLFRYGSGIAALRLANARGHVVVLPFMGQMVWDAIFDGVDLSMQDMFAEPRPAESIVGTYGCFAFHSGLLSNGCPSPQDSHPLHGEMPCAPMQAAGLDIGEDGEGPFMAVTGTREWVMGFGAHYLARPRVVLRPGKALFDIEMAVENRSFAPMDLMYMAHVNFAFVEGGRIVQPTGFTAKDTVVRTAVPGHVKATPAYLGFIDALAADPSGMEVLDEPARYDPEQVFYVRNLKTDATGHTRVLLRRPQGDALSIAWKLADLPHTVRWILVNGDQKVAAFALPATCEPEGYLAEKAKGHVRSLAAGATARFSVRLGHLDGAEADAAEAAIRRY
ncbi:DUF4432 family protein [Siculibacillus lacustris]|uniref:DUF4432 family protein n=1 Tax=Siculibacillus lacustris TaxID=1549641 RepID=A0A4Q9VY27_9HYPH|nr:aldose 1-epimerase family protein [Siculibacillus lacustris]TBW41402.1 DUF4432 family protein [Siculibacillus lacustris]